jgi:hypothetical protein
MGFGTRVVYVRVCTGWLWVFEEKGKLGKSRDGVRRDRESYRDGTFEGMMVSRKRMCYRGGWRVEREMWKKVVRVSDTDDTLQVGTWASQLKEEVDEVVEGTLGDAKVARRDFGWRSTAAFLD